MSGPNGRQKRASEDLAATLNEYLCAQWRNPRRLPKVPGYTDTAPLSRAMRPIR